MSWPINSETISRVDRSFREGQSQEDVESDIISQYAYVVEMRLEFLKQRQAQVENQVNSIISDLRRNFNIESADARLREVENVTAVLTSENERLKNTLTANASTLDKQSEEIIKTKKQCDVLTEMVEAEPVRVLKKFRIMYNIGERASNVIAGWSRYRE